jgi:hypothetical protein
MFSVNVISAELALVSFWLISKSLQLRENGRIAFTSKNTFLFDKALSAVAVIPAI